MAQYVFQNLINRYDLTDQFYIDSAATSREEIGNPVHHGTLRKLKEVGIPCGDHRARQLEKREYDEFDYLIGMDSILPVPAITLKKNFSNQKMTLL